jgi:hypothetical protein
MNKTGLGKAALAVSVFACTSLLSVGWTEQRGASLSIERAQAQMADPFAPGVERRQARRTAAGAAAVGAGVVAAGATAAYYGSGSPYAYYGGPGGYGSPAYYRGPGVWSSGYATQNGIICQPGTMVRLDDGLMHRCQ